MYMCTAPTVLMKEISINLLWFSVEHALMFYISRPELLEHGNKEV